MVDRHNGCLLGFDAFAGIFQIAVDDHDGVIDDHSEHHDEACQRDDVQRDVGKVHDGHGDERAERNGDGSDDGRPQGEEHHHDEDDDCHGQQQVAQEVANAVADDLWLVGNACQGDVVGQLGVAELVEHTINIVAISHDVVARDHLQREQHAGMTILLDVARRSIVFALDGGDVADAHHLARERVAVDDLIGHLGFAVLRGLNVDDGLLVVAHEAACHRGEPLRLQGRHECLLTDAERLQTLAVDVEAHLLLVFAVEAHVGHGGYLAQPVGEAVAIVLQLAVAAFLALDGNEQGRGVAKVVVGHQCQHARGQALLVERKAMLDFRPHLVLVVHLVVQVDEHHCHAVLRRRCGLGAVYLAIGEEIALERARHLLFDFLAGGTRIDGHHHALADGERWKLVLGHHPHAVDADAKEDGYQQERNLIVIEWPGYPLGILHASQIEN